MKAKNIALQPHGLGCCYIPGARATRGPPGRTAVQLRELGKEEVPANEPSWAWIS